MTSANDLERQLDYPLGEALPAPGSALEVAPGVRWVRMPLPFQLDHVNLWLLRDRETRDDGSLREGWAIVDCGIADDRTRAGWEQVFAEALGGAPVLRVIVTHLHPDHIGLAHWLTERFGVRLWISATDFETACRVQAGADAIGGPVAARFMAAHGLTDPALQRGIAARGNDYARLVPALPRTFRRLLDGDLLTIGAHDWRCHVGHGHAPEHIALHAPEAGVLIAGDMVLPRISTNVSVHETEPEADPLRRYLASLERMRALPTETLVLPSHGRPFRGLHTRIDQLAAHHEARFADVLAACAEAPQHAAGLLGVLFRRQLDLHQTSFAMGESIAHLNALWLAGRLRRRLDADGIYRFSIPASTPPDLSARPVTSTG